MILTLTAVVAVLASGLAPALVALAAGRVGASFDYQMVATYARSVSR